MDSFDDKSVEENGRPLGVHFLIYHRQDYSNDARRSSLALAVDIIEDTRRIDSVE